MPIAAYQNISQATAGSLSSLLQQGVRIEVRGKTALELRNQQTVLLRPRERCLFVRRRENYFVGPLAETLWVLAGRDDIGWLTTFLPRAPEFSDDGITWRGAYGPRLRNWNGVDQLSETRRLLLTEPATRQAAMVLYDPGRDFVDSKDIPCTNWLHWLLRDGNLHLTIAMRSNDIMWGFSGINSFEWSVLQEMMAYWVGAKVGDATYLASSFHLYECHEDRAREITRLFNGVSCYDFGLLSPRFCTRFEDFDAALKTWFAYEAEFRSNPDQELRPNAFDDPFLQACLGVVRLHHGVEKGWASTRLRDEIAGLPVSDFAAAAYENFGRRNPQVLQGIPHPAIANFINAFHASETSDPPSGRVGDA